MRTRLRLDSTVDPSINLSKSTFFSFVWDSIYMQIFEVCAMIQNTTLCFTSAVETVIESNLQYCHYFIVYNESMEFSKVETWKIRNVIVIEQHSRFLYSNNPRIINLRDLFILSAFLKIYKRKLRCYMKRNGTRQKLRKSTLLPRPSHFFW